MRGHIYKLRYALAFVFTAITIALTLLPSESMPDQGLWDIPFGDKLGHLIAYTSLGFSWHLIAMDDKMSMVKVVLALLTLGIILEMGQFYFLVGRYFEMYDIIANIIGAIVGVTLQRIIYRRYPTTKA